MKISELIKELDDIYESHGDVKVYLDSFVDDELNFRSISLVALMKRFGDMEKAVFLR